MKRHFLAMASVCVLATTSVFAQGNYPQKPIKLFVGSPPGSASDVAARIVADSMAKSLGQPVIVEAKPGQAGAIALRAVARSAPDGYTLGLGTSAAMIISPIVIKDLGYEPQKDLQAISFLAKSSFVLLTGKNSGFDSVQTFFDAAKKKPGELSWASVSPTFQFLLETVKQKTDVDLINVNYKGTAEAVTDVVEGRVSVMPDTIGTASLSLVQDGRLSALAVFEANRSPVLPNVPTIAELGYPGLEMSGFTGIVAPKGLPPEVAEKLYQAVKTATSDEAVIAKFKQLGMQPLQSTSEEMTEAIRRESQRLQEIAKNAGFGQ